MTERRGQTDDATQTGEHRVLKPGTVLADRYEIIQLAGMGGMGMVYRARDTRLGIEVAVKILSGERASDPETLQRFERELVLARQVSHPNVVRIHDIGQDGDTHFLTMDFVPGRSLKAVLEEDGPLSPEAAASIGRDLASALAAAHETGVVHRDLKPANVLLDEDGRASITDFGVARSVSGRGPTKTGHVLGTPDYLSPEQALGEQVDGRSDIYALGLVLYEMVTGDLPFSADSYDESLAQRIAGRPRNLEQSGIRVPAWLQAIIRKCLEREAVDRYQKADQLAADLASHAQPSRIRGRWRLRVVGAIALAIVLGLAWLFYPAPTTRDNSEMAESAPAQGEASRSLAVVPFSDETGRPTLGWVSTGVAEMIAIDLAQAPSLEVVDSLRVFRTTRDLSLNPGILAPTEMEQLAGLLDAGLMVMGRVRSAGDALLLEARLMEVGAAGSEAIRFSREVPGPSAIQSATAALTADIRRHLEAEPSESAESILSASPDAMAAYGEGVERLALGDTLEALPPLTRAVEADPRFAAAWVRLAEARQSLGYRNEAIEAAKRAVAELENPEGRVALEARALRASLEGDTSQAIDLRRRLAERYPNDIEARVRLGELLGDSGDLDSARETLSRVVERDPSHPRAWYLLGKFSILAGESQRAIDEYLVRALVVQNRLDNEQARADVLNAMGIAYSQVGNLEEAQAQYEKAAAIRRDIGDRRGVAATLSNLARIQALRGQYDQAAQRLDEALKIQQELGDQHGVAYLHNEQGILEEEQGHYEAALEHYRNGLRVRRDLGDSRALAESLNNVGYMYFLLGEYDNAALYIEQALENYRQDDNTEGVMLAQETLAQLETARANWDAALHAALAALEAGRELDSPGTEAVAQGVIGRVAFHQGRYEAALKALDEALSLVTELGDPRGVAEFALARAEVLVALGAAGQAEAELEEVESQLADGGNREQRSALLLLRGQTALRAGDTAAGLDYIARAVEEGEASGSITAHLQARLAMGRARFDSDAGSNGMEILESVTSESAGIGHVPILLECLEALARVQRRAGDDRAALDTVGRALDIAGRHAPWGRQWRLHLLRGELQESNGESGKAAFDRAARELERIRGNVPEAYRPAFERESRVGAIDESRPQSKN